MITSTVVSEILDYVSKCGGRYSDWYFGIASNPRDRLFNGHCVNEQTGNWIFRDAGSEAEARSIEKYFLSLGCDGGCGGGDYNTRYVYAYKKTWQTNP